MREPTDIELAYMAGVMDSDGHIGVHVNWYKVKSPKWADSKQPTYQPRCSVKQLDPEAVELFGEVFGGNFYVDTGAQSKRGSGRPINVWQQHSRQAVGTIRTLRPFLRVKRKQADLAIELGELNATPRRHTFVIPDVVDGEPLLPLRQAAERAGRSYATAYQSVKLRNIPFVRRGERGNIYVPESYIETWRTRPAGAGRRPEISERMAVIAEQIKALNSGKRGQEFRTPRRYVS